MNIRNSIRNSLDIFQEKMNKSFNGLDYVITYIDKQMIISYKSFKDHIKKLDIVLSKLKLTGFKVNTDKSFLVRSEVECLGFKITSKDTMHLTDKVEAIKNIAVPTTKKQLRIFMVFCHYYGDLWQHRSVIALSIMTSKQAKWNQNKDFSMTAYLSEITTILGPVKVRLRTPSSSEIQLLTRNKPRSTTGLYDI